MNNPVQGPEIYHAPYGEQHPYQQQPYERFPREPGAGQKVSLGAQTRPAGAFEKIWASWKINGVSGECETPAERLLEGEEAVEADTWRAQLPAFAPGERVSYRLNGCINGKIYSTEGFEFEVRRPYTAQELRRAELLKGQVWLELTGDRGEIWGNLGLSFLPKGMIRLDWDFSKEGFANGKEGAAQGLAYQVIENSFESLVIAGEELEISFQRQPFHMQVRRKGGEVLLEEVEAPSIEVVQDGKPRQIRQCFASPQDEAFFGFGERFNAMNQRNNVLDVRVFEQYKNQGTRTYIPIPFFFSSRGYGMYLQTSRYVTYDLAAGQTEQWSYTAELGEPTRLTAYVIAADDPKQILSAFTELVGKPVLPPTWTFGLWMSANDWNSQARVLDELHQAQQHEIPTTVLVIEAWSDESNFFIWNDAQYSLKPADQAYRLDDFTFPPEGRWPDPKAMIDELHAAGVRLILWQIPVIKEHLEPDGYGKQQNLNDQAYAIQQGYVVRKKDGDPYRVRPGWFHDSLLMDPTNPKGVEWWMSRRAYLLDELEVDGFKTDGGEHVWGQDVVTFDEREGDEIWNEYPRLYTEAFYKFATQHRNGDAALFSRSGFTGAQASPCHWAGDESSTWEAFRASLLAMQNMGMSGIPFMGWDLAGFSGEPPTAELYLRAVQAATFCPIMQYHSEYNARRIPCHDRTPWNIQALSGDPEVIPIFRKFASLRMSLLPYILSQAWASSQSGAPLMRALPFEFPGDAACRRYPYEYLFGDALLVAPVVQPGSRSTSVYLPEGEWRDLWSGERLLGPMVVEREVPKESLPVFQRAGSIVPLNLGDDLRLGGRMSNDLQGYKNLTFKVVPAGTTRVDWYDYTRGESFPVSCEAEQGKVRVATAALPCQFALCVATGQPLEVLLDGQALPEAESFKAWQERGGWFYEAGMGEVWVHLAAGEAVTVEVRTPVL